jgi:hypothetical protein
LLRFFGQVRGRKRHARRCCCRLYQRSYPSTPLRARWHGLGLLAALPAATGWRGDQPLRLGHPPRIASWPPGSRPRGRRWHALRKAWGAHAARGPACPLTRLFARPVFAVSQSPQAQARLAHGRRAVARLCTSLATSRPSSHRRRRWLFWPPPCFPNCLSVRL